MKNQKGYLLILAGILVVVVAFVSMTMTRLFVGRSQSTVNDLQSKQALFVTNAGLEVALYNVKNNLLTCNNTWSATQTIGNGQFKTRCTQYTGSTTLSAAISAANTIIPLSSSTGFAPIGRVTIESESINYQSVSSVSAVCNTQTCGGSACAAPCLVGATRGAGGSAAAVHNSGSTISQTQSVVEAQGAVPTLANAVGQHDLQAAIIVSGQTVYAAGEGPSQALYWNGATWALVALPFDNNGENGQGADCADVNHCWIVGKYRTNVFYWNGSTWVQQSMPGNGQIKLQSVTCTAANNCFAVGEKSNAYQWNGSSWSAISLPSGNNELFNDVTCPTANECWVVGSVPSRVYHLIGGTWSAVSIPGTYNSTMNTVACTATNDCWIGGAKTTAVLHWDGTSWSSMSIPAGYAQAQNGSVCVSSNDCWMVGNNTTNVLHWNGSTWSLVSIPGSYANLLNDIDCIDSSHCWAVGASTTLLLQWDGAAWSTVSQSYGNILNAVTALPTGTATMTILGQQEIFY